MPKKKKRWLEKKLTYKKGKKEKQMIIRLRNAPEMLEEELEVEKTRFFGRASI
jgi:hypothetical protein